MQWSAEAQGGFSSNSKPVLKAIGGGAYGYKRVNVAEQRRDPNSLLNWMERIIRMRKEVPEIGWGDFEVLRTSTPQVLAIRFDWRENSVVVIHNLNKHPREIRVNIGLQAGKGRQLVNLLSTDHSSADDSGVHRILLEPYGYRWYRAGGLTYLLDRSEA